MVMVRCLVFIAFLALLLSLSNGQEGGRMRYWDYKNLPWEKYLDRINDQEKKMVEMLSDEVEASEKYNPGMYLQEIE